ncbi:DUF2214 family protein [Undibacterium sp. Ji50W]|uniref:DUF2214 family protein n=1 Tax=Undibacterium sp. Ji50W TaxID=3413041 RepID=UPI003BF378E9
MNLLVAFLHHLAAFTLVSSLVAEMILIRQPLSVSSAKSLRTLDGIYGVSAMLILVMGILRVIYFEKGAAYYLHNHAFLLKMTAFIVVGLLSIYPTMIFLRWAPALKQNQLPLLSPAQAKNIRRVLHLELAGIVVIILGAVLMAKGAGFTA